MRNGKDIRTTNVKLALLDQFLDVHAMVGTQALTDAEKLLAISTVAINLYTIAACLDPDTMAALMVMELTNAFAFAGFGYVGLYDFAGGNGLGSLSMQLLSPGVQRLM